MSNNTERVQYQPEEQRELSDAILEAIDRHRDKDITRSDVRLYDDINLDALDNLFRERTDTSAVLKFDTGAMQVKISYEEAIAIRVTSRSDN